MLQWIAELHIVNYITPTVSAMYVVCKDECIVYDFFFAHT